MIGTSPVPGPRGVGNAAFTVGVAPVNVFKKLYPQPRAASTGFEDPSSRFQADQMEKL